MRWWVAMCSCLVGCGPGLVDPSTGGGQAGSSGAVTSGLSTETGAAEDTSSDGGDISEKLDVTNGAPDPVEACAFEPPASCDPTWPPEDDLGPVMAEAIVAPSGEALEIRYTVEDSPEALVQLSVAFELPCIEGPAGVPPDGPSSYAVDAEVSAWGFGGFEWSLMGVYPAAVTVARVSDCLHLLVLDIEVTDPVSMPPFEQPFEWPELLETGYMYVPW